MSVRMAEDALLLQRLLNAVNGVEEGDTGSTSDGRPEHCKLQQTTRKQYLKIWLIGQVNLFSTSYGRM
jgi:hypothetical protein